MAVEKSFIEDIDKKNLFPARLIRGFEVGTIKKIIIPPEVQEYPDFYFLGAKEIEDHAFFQIGDEKIPLFAQKEITYPGQPLFIATHPDPRVLKKLCDHFTIEVTSPKEEKPPSLNPYKEITSASGAVQKLFSNAHEIVSNQYQTGIQNHYSLGHQGAVAIPGKENMTIIAPTEWSELVLSNISAALGILPEKITFQPSKRTPAFGTKCWYPALIATQVALLSQKTQKGLRLLFSKEEDLLQTTRRSPYQITIETALNSEKEIIAQRFSIQIAGGAYPLFCDTLLNIIEKSIKGLYKKVPLSYKITILQTPHSALDFFSGSGLAPLFFAIERQMDEISKKVQLSPLSLRQKYFDATFSPEDLTPLLHYCKKQGDYDRKQIAYGHQNKLYHSQTGKGLQTIQRQRGIGIALAWQGSRPDQQLYPEFLFDRIPVTRPPLKKDINETAFEFLTFGVACAEVSINPISLEIIPQQFTIALQAPPNANKKELKLQIQRIIMPALRWITINQDLNLNNDYPELTIPFPRRLPKIDIEFFETETAIEQSLPDLIFNLIPPAFASAASQALAHPITKLPLLVEDFHHLKESPSEGESHGV